MKLVKPSVYRESHIDQGDILRQLERIGRTAYKSEDKVLPGSAQKFVEMIIKREHLGILEHCQLSFRMVIDRGVLAELTRHRLCSFVVESTRYVNYARNSTGGLVFVIPPWATVAPEDDYLRMSGYPRETVLWLNAMALAEEYYVKLINIGCKPEQARSVLPMSLKTELVMTANLRQLRTMLELRTAPAAHPQMREIMGKLLDLLVNELPVIFKDLKNG